MSSRAKRNIFALIMLAIIAIMLVLAFIMDSGVLKTDKEYWIVFTLLMIVGMVSLPIAIIMARKNFLEVEEKRVKKMIDKHNKDK